MNVRNDCDCDDVHVGDHVRCSNGSIPNDSGVGHEVEEKVSGGDQSRLLLFPQVVRSDRRAGAEGRGDRGGSALDHDSVGEEDLSGEKEALPDGNPALGSDCEGVAVIRTEG
jgi:hypothetical protein